MFIKINALFIIKHSSICFNVYDSSDLNWLLFTLIDHQHFVHESENRVIVPRISSKPKDDRFRLLITEK